MKKLKKTLRKELKKCRKLYPKINYTYNLKFFNSSKIRTIAYFSKKEDSLAFNLFYMKDLEKKFIKEIARHEIAHLITREVFGYSVQIHGKEWRGVMFTLGSVKPRATMDLSKNSESLTSTFKMKCKCKTHFFTKNKRTRLRNGMTYKCNLCNKKIKEI